jgi:rubrerythrin
MAGFFQAAEIAAAAVNIEQQGQAFYRQAAEASKKPDIQDFFLFFAEEEARHEQFFQQLKDRLGRIELPAWSTSEEYSAYLQALIDSHSIFSPQLQKGLAEATSENEAIRLAMGFEKDTILFFMEMKELVPQSEQKIVQQCIEEEREHFRRLSKMLT